MRLTLKHAKTRTIGDLIGSEANATSATKDKRAGSRQSVKLVMVIQTDGEGERFRNNEGQKLGINEILNASLLR
jgi:hypothetical protein